MNALCTLRSIRLQVAEKRVIPLRRPGSGEKIGAIRPELGHLSGITIEVDPDIWMVVHHPDHGLIGLPLNGEGGSWQTQWENENISLEVRTVGRGWQEVHDWNVIRAATGGLRS